MQDYNLNTSFDLKQQQITVHLIFPFSALHSVGFVAQLGAYLAYSFYLASVDEPNPRKEIFWREIVNLVSSATK